MSLAAVFVVMCALGMATPLPIPVSPVPMSPVNTTVLQCITNVQSTVQSSLLWANRLVRSVDLANVSTVFRVWGSLLIIMLP